MESRVVSTPISSLDKTQCRTRPVNRVLFVDIHVRLRPPRTSPHVRPVPDIINMFLLYVQDRLRDPNVRL